MFLLPIRAHVPDYARKQDGLWRALYRNGWNRFQQLLHARDPKSLPQRDALGLRFRP